MAVESANVAGGSAEVSEGILWVRVKCDRCKISNKRIICQEKVF